ncbi:hypothetical protein GCM10023191_095040 [Actinoallomurus oryzae]|uniref:ATP-dependent DNA ligase family profile domain-containing protein n=2 Tax=Actinoallomurus oryzae TaxID=502180 RepID=A0ABP8R6W0_9ACTN
MGELPGLIAPMMAVLRHGLPENDDAFGFELKWDGVRSTAYVADGAVRLMSRNAKDMSATLVARW